MQPFGEHLLQKIQPPLSKSKMWFVEYFYQIISSWASLIFMHGAHLDQKKALTYKSGDHQLRESGYPSIHKILYIPGDCWGFLPSTVVANCQVFFFKPGRHDFCLGRRFLYSNDLQYLFIYPSSFFCEHRTRKYVYSILYYNSVRVFFQWKVA